MITLTGRVKMKHFKTRVLLTIVGCSFGLLACNTDSLNENSDSMVSQQIESRFDKIPQHIYEQIENGVKTKAEAEVEAEELKKKERSISRGIAFVGHEELTWRKKTVTVSFEGGNGDVHKLVEATANKWTESGGYLSFSFRDPNGNFRIWDKLTPATATDIRISFRDDKRDGGYWSVPGTTAQFVERSEPTMNFEGFENDLIPYFGETNGWLNSYEHATILHEFGHALGLAHEHFHSDCQSDMKIKRVVKKFVAGGWSGHDSKFNVQRSYYLKTMLDNKEITTGPFESHVIDQNSVMLYRAFSKKYYKSGGDTPCKPLHPSGYAIALSDGDMEYYMEQYGFLRENTQ